MADLARSALQAAHSASASLCAVPGHWGPGVLPQTVAVALSLHAPTLTSSTLRCSGEGERGLVPYQVSTG